MIPCTLDLLYYTLAEIAKTNKVIATAISEFVAKTIDNKNEYLQRYAIYLIDNLELLQFLYLK